MLRRLYEQRSARPAQYLCRNERSLRTACALLRGAWVQAISRTCICGSRYGYLRWEPSGGRQLRLDLSNLRQDDFTFRTDEHHCAPVEHLDLATGIKSFGSRLQVIVLENLIDTLMPYCNGAGRCRASAVDVAARAARIYAKLTDPRRIR